MNGNGDARIQAVEADARDLRQLMLAEFRSLRAELKHIKEIGQHNAKALDILLAHARLEEAENERG
jgi:hypothetical protein